MDAFRRLGAVVIIEDIAALPRLDEIRKVDHIDVFLAAP
jgi:2-keto-3-deoxy-L-rhamnonate aldolase RhmA